MSYVFNVPSSFYASFFYPISFIPSVSSFSWHSLHSVQCLFAYSNKYWKHLSQRKFCWTFSIYWGMKLCLQFDSLLRFWETSCFFRAFFLLFGLSLSTHICILHYFISRSYKALETYSFQNRDQEKKSKRKAKCEQKKRKLSDNTV